MLGYRLHHGMFGLGMMSAGTATQNPVLLVVGAMLMWHDRRDFPWPWDRYVRLNS